MHMLQGKVARYEDKVLILISKAKPKALPDVGYVEERGRRAIETGRGVVPLFFPVQQSRRTVRFSRRLFVPGSVEIIPPDAPTQGSARA